MAKRLTPKNSQPAGLQFSLMIASVWLLIVAFYFFVFDLNPDFRLFDRTSIGLVTVVGFTMFLLTAWWLDMASHHHRWQQARSRAATRRSRRR